MATSETAELFAKGMEALGHGHFYLARTCFERAVAQERTPRHCSYLAISLAETQGANPLAIAIGREALAQEPENPQHYLHLSRIYVMAGWRQDAIDLLREGIGRTGAPDLVRELERLGTRKPVVIKSLPRSHFLNKYLGLILNRLRLR